MSDRNSQNSGLPHWLNWARRLDALAQSGLTFSESHFEIERYRQIRDIAAEIVQHHSDMPKEQCIDNLAQQQGYATPKIDVRGAVIRKEKILLVQEKSDGNWCMPGGWADVGESPAESVVREVWEESGFRTRVTKVIAVLDANRSGRPLVLYHAFKIIFWCEILDGSPTPSDETLAVDFFPFHDIPALSSNRTSEQHLKIIREYVAQPELPTFFD